MAGLHFMEPCWQQLCFNWSKLLRPIPCKYLHPTALPITPYAHELTICLCVVQCNTTNILLIPVFLIHLEPGWISNYIMAAVCLQQVREILTKHYCHQIPLYNWKYRIRRVPCQQFIWISIYDHFRTFGWNKNYRKEN